VKKNMTWLQKNLT